MLQGEHERLTNIPTDRQTDRQGESNLPPNFVAEGYKYYVSIAIFFDYTSLGLNGNNYYLNVDQDLELYFASLFHDYKMVLNTDL